MLKLIVKKILAVFKIDVRIFIQKVSYLSIKQTLRENGFSKLAEELRTIKPDISRQYSNTEEFNEYWELKLRVKHAFQCSLMLKVLESLPCGKLTITIVDIGDSAGTHMEYLKELSKGRFDINTISVNLDPIAVEKIKAQGQIAILCRAEELNLENDHKVDLFTSFQMVEHLHNPALFFRRLAKESPCNRMVVTVPYVKISRVGLHFIHKNIQKVTFAEDEHIFELNPQDWTLLMLHSGWRVIYSQIYYQYPREIPALSFLLSRFWRRYDFEGFWELFWRKI
ncbi:MAG: hypothetical protein Q8O13_06970 [Candidatus Omnitrophota bacterium]|nr:hypothetical protein [Candidatus Omnitrophota bacterium]